MDSFIMEAIESGIYDVIKVEKVLQEFTEVSELLLLTKDEGSSTLMIKT